FHSIFTGHSQVCNDQVDIELTQKFYGRLHVVGTIDSISNTLEIAPDQLDRLGRVVNYQYVCLCAHACVRCRPCFTGNVISNFVPFPRVLLTAIFPLWLSIMPCTTESPRPVPWPGGLVVKNGSKILFFTSGVSPSPVS